MAAQDDDDYSDDDLDALAGDEFLQLQEQALQATQGQKSVGATSAHDLGQSTALDTSRLAVAANAASFGSDGFTHQSSDYGDLDEEVLDAGTAGAPDAAAIATSRPGQAAHNDDEVAPREQWRQNRFSEPSLNTAAQYVQQPNTNLPHRGATPSSSAKAQPNGARQQPAGSNVQDFKSDGNNDSLEARLHQVSHHGM
jgi:hypothetical protein